MNVTSAALLTASVLWLVCHNIFHVFHYIICSPSRWNENYLRIIYAWIAFIILQFILNQEIIDWTGTATFVKEPKLAKLFREQKATPALYNNKVHWILPHVCNGKFAVFWVLYCGIIANGRFFLAWIYISISLHKSLKYIW